MRGGREGRVDGGVESGGERPVRWQGLVRVQMLK